MLTRGNLDRHVVRGNLATDLQLPFMSGRQDMSVTWRDPHGFETGDRSRAFCPHKIPGTGDRDERVFGFRVHVQRECGVGGNSGNNQREMAADWPVKWQRSTCERVSAGFR